MNALPTQPHPTEVNLAPGEFFFGGGFTRVHTLLGSCVAITLWHPRKHIGGMCHYLLPSRGLNQQQPQGHYADEAVQLFLQAIHKASTRPGEYQVKVFGGSNMFTRLGQGRSVLNISNSNVERGCLLLRQHGFNVVAKDVGGERHRKIYLELWNGDVWVRRGVPGSTG